MNKEINLNFLFGALTFIHLFLPIVIKVQQSYPNLKPRFFIRHNLKKYGDPIIHQAKYQKLFQKYQIEILSGSELKNYPGIILCVDGDTYGPRAACWNESLLLKIDRTQYVILSLTESLNFKWSYPTYQKWVDHTILIHPIYAKTYNLKASNLYLGNPKYDFELDPLEVYRKHNLDPTKKYVTFFYPRFDRGLKKYGKGFLKYYQNMMQWCQDLDLIVLTKNRAKQKTPIKFKSNYFVDTDYFPHISLELLAISSLSIFCGSAVIEEIVMSKVPFIEYLFDDVNRLAFLRDPSYSTTLKKLIGEDKFKEEIKRLIDVPKENFQKTFDTYLQSNIDSSSSILDHGIELYNKLN